MSALAGLTVRDGHVTDVSFGPACTLNSGQMSVSEVVERALGLMKNLVEIQTDVMEVTVLPAKRFELSFYRNQVS